MKFSVVALASCLAFVQADFVHDASTFIDGAKSHISTFAHGVKTDVSKVASEASTFATGHKSDISKAASEASTFITGHKSDFSNIASNIASHVTDIDNDISKVVATATKIAGSEGSKLVAQLTSEYGPAVTSLEHFASTADPSLRASASKELNHLKSEFSHATSVVAAAETSTGGGPMPTAAVAMGALMGGAAVFANM